MAYTVRMPKLGVEMEQGVVLEWHAEEGETVEEGELVAEIESEKTQAEVTAREAGVLRRIILAVDEEGEPGAAMGIVGDPEEDISDLLAEADADPDGGADDADGAGDAGADDGESAPSPGETDDGPTPAVTEAGGDGGRAGGTADGVAAGGAGGATAVSASPGGDGVKVSPRARARADELGVDAAAVEGTGPEGSVTAADVERAAESGTPPASAGLSAGDGATVEGSAAAATPDAASADDTETSRTPVERREQSRMRSTIARRLSESWREAPHVTVDRRVDAEPLFAAVEAAEASGHDVSMTDVLLRAVSETLAEHPEFNATFEDDVHTIYEEHNVGVAVDVEQGLITPVIPDVGSKTVDEIAAVRGELTDRALSGEYTGDDLSGGTFTVSNLGVFGVDSFTPIINPPEVAILGVNGIEEKPVRGERGGIAWHRTIGFSLSFDHRVVDGADAAKFLATLSEKLDDAVALVP
jgi:pyruvate/2-oxoglutarate dehydrogenase complex dihydrolipoamide acyltransferase (E2) component